MVQRGKLCRTHVTALARTGSLDFVRGQGVDEVVGHLSTRISALGSFDVIVDSARSGHRALRRLLAPGGRMVALTTDVQHRLAGVAYLVVSAFGRGHAGFVPSAATRPPSCSPSWPTWPIEAPCVRWWTRPSPSTTSSTRAGRWELVVRAASTS